jgi:ElaB/YqjD/DUF883 family membrane-anchored ribosome-binding protein
MAESGTGSRAKGATDGDLDALRADLAALRTEMTAVVSAVKQLGETAVKAAKRQQHTAVDRLAAEAGTLAEDVASVGRDQLAQLESRIRDQPLAAVGIAFLAGLLFGSLRR